MTITTELASDMISPKLFTEFQQLNEEQRRIVLHDQGPMTTIAGPGSGKTRCLTLRAMNLLLLKRATPQEVVLCTYTEKAAFEMQDRLSSLARQVGYSEDVAQIRVGTIHGICNRMIAENLHRLPAPDQQMPPLGNNYETLDRISQGLFIFENLETICGRSLQFFVNRWGSRWAITKQLQKYFEKITEELIAINRLLSEPDYLLQNLAHAYKEYQRLLVKNNCLDFAHLQKMAYWLLHDPRTASLITRDIGYVLVDEYQDTNHIQEQILVKLASRTNSICVVGDEDQSLYRFRGATVQNLRNFPRNFGSGKKVEFVLLTANYRSHPAIVGAYDSWMASVDWGSYRSGKKIQSCAEKRFVRYPAVLSILGRDPYDEALRFAEFVAFLKENGNIADYNQVALLLNSVKTFRSDVYVQALQERGIEVFCPRAGNYFDQEEVQLMIGCFARILRYAGGLSRETVGHTYLMQYVDHCSTQLAEACARHDGLEARLLTFEAELTPLADGQRLDRRLADYFYALLAAEPFALFLKEESKMLNLVNFSQLLEKFEKYYRYQGIGGENRAELASYFFNIFSSTRIQSNPFRRTGYW
jgi:DNA helicase II / ATP-dependent DNA helicase PcrA